MQLTVRTVDDRRTLRDFLNLPHAIYRDDPNWISPLHSEIRRSLDVRRNPYFRDARLEMFLVYSGHKPVARTSIAVNIQHQVKYRTKAAFFGFFECVDDATIATALFAAAEGYCRSQDVTLLEGPFNPNHYSELGIQLNEYNRPPSFFQTYNPPYYVELLDAVGFREAHRLFTARNVDISGYLRRRYGVPGKSTPQGGFAVRTLATGNLRTDLEGIREVFNDAFASNWHFLPLSREEYRYSTKHLSQVTRPELVTIVEHWGTPVGVGMCVLDVNPLLKRMRGRAGPLKYLRFCISRRNIRNLILYAVGIKKEYQKWTTVALLFDALHRVALDYETLETTWISPDNRSAVRAAEALGLQPDKYFAIYEKKLEP